VTSYNNYFYKEGKENKDCKKTNSHNTLNTLNKQLTANKNQLLDHNNDNNTDININNFDLNKTAKKIRPMITATPSTFSKFVINDNMCNSNIFKYNTDFYPPFKKYNFYIHPSCYEESSIKDRNGNKKNINNSVVKINEVSEINLEAIQFIIRILMGKVVENVRMSDYCVINRLDKNKIPSHIRLVNTQFLIDCLIELKLMDYERYQPLEFKKR